MVRVVDGGKTISFGSVNGTRLLRTAMSLHLCRFSLQINRFHISTFSSPQDPTVQHIKRVIKSPGEFVRLKNGTPAMLGVNDYWMLSDNGATGKDSRVYGPVNLGLFQGKALFIMWPPSRIGKIV